MVILGNEEEGWNPGQGHMSHQRGQKTIFFRFQPQFVTVFLPSLFCPVWWTCDRESLKHRVTFRGFGVGLPCIGSL